MRLPSTRGRGEVGWNMTPMIDVVFLLIIFFLVSSHLVQQETHMELRLPTAAQGNPAPDDRRARVVVNVTSEGRLVTSGSRVTPAELTEILAERRRGAGRDIEVRIRCDRTAPYRFIERVMLACTRAGIWNVAFAVTREEGR